MTRFLRSLLLVACLVPLTASPVKAGAVLNINDLSETVSVTGTGFDFGFTSQTVGEFVSFSGTWLAGNATASFSKKYYFVEAANPQLISDVLQVQATSNGQLGFLSGTFKSDINDELGTLPTPLDGTVIVEGVSPTLHLPNPIPNLDMTFDSDVEGGTIIPPPPQVSEPASITLLGIGIAGLAGYGWRRRKLAKA